MYKCPKCGGTNFYYAKKRVEYGAGFTRYSMDEKRPFCHKDDIEAVWYGNETNQWIAAGIIAVVGIIGLMIWSSAGFPAFWS